MKALRLAAALALLAGSCLSGRALYLKGKAWLASVLVRMAWEETLRTGRDAPPWPWADTYPVGRLLIPRLGYDEVILEGASPRNLAFGPARLMSNAEPGEPGNLVLAGHRTSWFQPIKDVSVGDSIVIESRHRATGRRVRRSYQVELTRVIEPQNVSFLRPTGRDVLTLLTCYPFGLSPASPQRYVVRAAATGTEYP